MSKIKSYYVVVNRKRYKRVISTSPLPMVCWDCYLDEFCGTYEMGVPCSGLRDYFIKV